MTIVCWSVKGGSGTTVVAAALALLCAERGPTVAIDLAGDLAAAERIMHDAFWVGVYPGLTDEMLAYMGEQVSLACEAG